MFTKNKLKYISLSLSPKFNLFLQTDVFYERCLILSKLVPKINEFDLFEKKFIPDVN